METAGRDFESRDHVQEHFSISDKEKKPGQVAGATPRTVAHTHVCTRDAWPRLSCQPSGVGGIVERPWGWLNEPPAVGAYLLLRWRKEQAGLCPAG